MKQLSVFFGGLLLGTTAVAAPGGNFGTHGMALFGGEQGVYASHLPMFHAPHDYQVILQIRLADPRQDAALRERLGGKAALWTVAPEKFALDRLAPQATDPLRQFKADLVLGHFERGGTTQYQGATVVVDKVLVYRQLSKEARTGDSARYLQLGSGTQRYLVKEIDSRPDFDHIVAIAAGPGTQTGTVLVPKQALAETPAGQLARALPGAKVTGTVYFDTADLK